MLLRATGRIAGSLWSRAVRISGGWIGCLFFVAVLAVVSALPAFNMAPGVRVFVEGEIATQDVAADRDLLVEDQASTALKRKQVADTQPVVFDLSREVADRLQERIARILERANQADDSISLDQARAAISQELNKEVSPAVFSLWRQEAVRSILLGAVGPWLGEQLNRGVVADTRLVRQFKQGMLVRDLSTGEETLRLDSGQIYDLNHLQDELEGYLRQPLKLRLEVRQAILQLIEPLLGPSLSFNAEATRLSEERVAAAVEAVYYQIKKGEVIVRQGERVSAADQIKLLALFSQERRSFQYYRPIGAFLLSVLLASGLVLTPFGRLFQPLPPRDAIVLGTLVFLFACAAWIVSYIDGSLTERLRFLPEGVSALAFPVAGAVGVLALFFRPRVCLSAGITVAFLCCLMFSGGLDLFAYYFLGSIAASLLIKRAETRSQLLRSVFPLLALLLTAWGGTRLVFGGDTSGLVAEACFVVANGLLSLLLVLALSPIVELVIDYTSRVRLMELMSLEQPLLREMMVNAPGTYHHSLVVANMVEAGAQQIGANALLCKVAALYHDIGKLRSPQYFIENQGGRKNPHDRLSPSMSALILISHVKKGVDLARKSRLGPEIADIIKQHHGTSVISYFFHKAKEMATANEDVSEEDYRYPGPKPQTREAALVLLADAVEASSRTLVDPSPARLKAHIGSIVQRILAEGQLDEAALTFRDLTAVSETFHRILTGIFHQRIDYPGSLGEYGDKPPQPAAEVLDAGRRRLKSIRGGSQSSGEAQPGSSGDRSEALG